jgi:SAM-dependent methyltransferase
MPTKDFDSNAPVGVDPTRASVARVYDALLGGKDNYAIDRQVMREMITAVPDVVEAARENRAFLIRVCRFIARQTGVVQYLDCGSGLPTAENIHQVVQRLNPESRVVYVDNDPVVLAHGRALLEEDDRTRLIDGDLFQPTAILENEVVRTHLDFTQPIALFQLATLHHYKGPRDRAAAVMHEYVNALPSGSYVAISHFYDPQSEDTAVTKALEDALAKGATGGATSRTHAEIMELFTGLDMVEPGVVPVTDWWSDGPHLKPRTPAQRLVAGGVGHKP